MEFQFSSASNELRCTLFNFFAPSDCEQLKSGEVSKESLSSPELDCRMDLCCEDEQA